jgi:hypothetical protein
MTGWTKWLSPPLSRLYQSLGRGQARDDKVGVGHSQGDARR